MTAHDARLVRNTSLVILALVALRLVAAALGRRLTFDEAYYWMWSKHLAFRLLRPSADGSALVNPCRHHDRRRYGVRLCGWVSILLALPMSFAILSRRRDPVWQTWPRSARERGDPCSTSRLMAAVRHADRHAGFAASRGLELRSVRPLPRCWKPGEGSGGSRWAPRWAPRCCRNTPALFFGAAILIWLLAVACGSGAG